MLPRIRAIPAVLVLALLAAACTSGGTDEPSPSVSVDEPQQVSAIMASTDHYVDAPQRVGLGLVLSDNRLVSFGSVDLRFSYVGTADQPQDPEPGPAATAVYVPTPGTPNEGSAPTVTQPSEARGIYVAEDVSFDRAGFWQVDVIADVGDLGSQRTSTTFPVTDEPVLPAPGQPALETRNMTIHDEHLPAGATLGSIDSRAVETDEVPDPELHEWTIADAVEQHRPALVLFATPVFCTSLFCGPVTDDFEGLAQRFADRAVFIHVEIWQDFEEQAITQAAADWLYRDGELTEPWTFLIDADGTIVDRWAVLFDDEQVAAELEALPRMGK